jgi:hypothetical protein
VSTYWYLQCYDHEPPLCSYEEVEQHTQDASFAALHELHERREEFMAREAEYTSKGMDFEPPVALDPYYVSHAWLFIRRHPMCRIRLINEYGDTRPL